MDKNFDIDFISFLIWLPLSHMLTIEGKIPLVVARFMGNNVVAMFPLRDLSVSINRYI